MGIEKWHKLAILYVPYSDNENEFAIRSCLLHRMSF